MSINKNYEKELFKQKIMKQVYDKNSDLYYLLRVPHYPDLLRQNVLLDYSEYDLKICLDLIPAHDIYQISFREGTVDDDFYKGSKIWNIMGPVITDIYREEVEFKENLAIFKLYQNRISNVGSEVKTTLLNTKSISYNIKTGEWALNLKEFKNALQFIQFLEDVRRKHNEGYFQYRVTSSIYTNIINSGYLNRPSINHKRFMNIIKNARELPIGRWTLKDIIVNLFYNRLA